MFETVTNDSRIKIYRGQHSIELYQALKKAWLNNELLIVCPPHLKDISFISKYKIPKEIVLGVFTSGTLSGKPRLVFYSKKNILSSLQAIRSLFDIKKMDKIFCYPQPTHTFGLTLGYVHSIVYDIPLVFSEGGYHHATHEKWFEQSSEGMLTLGAPVHFTDLISWLQRNNIQAKKTYSAIIGGAPVSKKIWFDVKNILNIEQPSIGYGATEASPGITHLPPGEEPEQDGEIGYALNNVLISEVDSTGFLFSGDNVCEAILDEEGLQFSSSIKIKDVLIKSSSNKYVFNGRADLLINRGGVKFSPEIIEAKIISELNIKAACVSFYSERLGEDIAFILQLNESLDLSIELQKNTTRQIQNILKESFSINLSDSHFYFHQIPLNTNAKYDRVECLKFVLKGLNIQTPISVKYLKSFLPHRSSAIWIDRITDFKFREGCAEVDLITSKPLFTNGELRESVCIELVAQTYGYATAIYEVFSEEKKEKANKTLIAEVRNAEFYFSDENKKIISQAIEAKIPLKIQAKCTHDFGLIKVIIGQVYIKEVLLAELSMKAFVSA